MSLKQSEFVSRIMDLLGKEHPVLLDKPMSLAEVKKFRLKLGDVMLAAIQDACEHEQKEPSWAFSEELLHREKICAICGKVLPKEPRP
jgi:hypothetical protein